MTEPTTRLADVLDRQREEEREQAVRALLRRPLLATGDPALALVRRHSDYLRDWFSRETGLAAARRTRLRPPVQAPGRHRRRDARSSRLRSRSLRGAVPRVRSCSSVPMRRLR